MKKLALLSGIGIAIVAGVSFWANALLDKAKELDAELTREFKAHVTELRDLETRYPDREPKKYPQERLDRCAAMRAKLVPIYESHKKSGAQGVFALRETRNAALTVLIRDLEAAQMGPAEYRRLSVKLGDVAMLADLDSELDVLTGRKVALKTTAPPESSSTPPPPK